MKLPPIDEITSVTQINEWIDSWIEKCLHVNPKDPVWLYDENGYIHPDSSIRDIYSTIDRVTELFCKIESLNHKISGIGNSRYTYPTYKDMKQWKSERISLYNELQELIETPMSFDVDDNTSMPETHNQTDFSHMESCQPTPKKKSKSIKDYMLVEDGQKDSLLTILHSLIDGKKGKDVALVILVCVQHGLIKKPEHDIMKKTFGEIGAKSGYNSYFGKGLSAYRPEEIKGIETHLSSFIDGL